LKPQITLCCKPIQNKDYWQENGKTERIELHVIYFTLICVKISATQKINNYKAMAI